jgi:hypothetical protein
MYAFQTSKMTMPTKRSLRPISVPIVHMPGRLLRYDGRTPDPDRLQQLPPRATPTRYLFDDADVLMSPVGGLSILRRGSP